MNPKQLKAQYAKEQLKRGFVVIRVDDCEDEGVVNYGHTIEVWEKKDYAIYDPKLNCHRRKIDFVMDYLGVDTVNRELLNRTDKSIAGIVSLVGDPGWAKKYRAKLDELCGLVTSTLNAG